MSRPPLSIVAPGLIEQPWSEAEVLGSVVWLWMHSASHRDFPLHTLPVLLLPAIKRRQFVLASEAGQPVFYLSWASFHPEAEQRYLANSPLLMPEHDWNCGDRLWLLDWVAPFGHTRAMSRIVTRQLFANRWWRALDHRGDARGLSIRTFQGTAVLRDEAREWFAAHPVAYPERPAPQSLAANLSFSMEK
ncbi:MAG: toxin-activating lysine-acyltransferase [Burkholderiaceae bacterium]|nr:toxin-activating lysine-acyltransferase [Burkholderiaceae bacterium]MDZ4143882.1 toxin-activating lysine-acyltransferase [Burkholderiales bacterium]